MKIKARYGETIPLTLTETEDGADTATITISDTEIVFQKTVSFEGLEADLTITAEESETIPVGEYEYMITVVYEDGAVQKYPDASCKDCGLPEFIICEANDELGDS